MIEGIFIVALISVLLGVALYYAKKALMPFFNYVKNLVQEALQIAKDNQKYGNKIFTIKVSDNTDLAASLMMEISRNYKVKHVPHYVSVDYFFRNLRALGFTYRYAYEYCDINDEYCTSIIEVTSRQGVKFIVRVTQNNRYNTLDRKDRVTVKFPQNTEDIKDYLKDNRFIRIFTDVTLHYPAALNNSNADLQKVIKIIRDGEIEVFFYPEDNRSNKTKVTLRQLRRTPFGYTLGIIHKYNHTFSEEKFNASYSDVTFTYDGEEISVSPSKAQVLIAEFAANGDSIFLHGKMGTGKTVFLTTLQQRFLTNAEHDFHILSVNAQDVKHLGNPDILECLDDYYGNNAETGAKLIIVVDEAERALIGDHSDTGTIHSESATLVASFTDGELSNKYNSTMIVTSNQPPSAFDAFLFRNGRFSIALEFGPLVKEKAVALFEILKSEGLVLQENKFNALLNNATKDASGKLLSKAGTMTLAELYSCVLEPTRDDKIRAILGLKSKENETNPPTKFTFKKSGGTPPATKKAVVEETPAASKQNPPVVGSKPKHQHRKRR